MALEIAMLACFMTADWRDEMNLVGDARWRRQVLRLTPAEENQAGGAWRREKVTVVGGFESRFRFRITESGGLGDGADGIAFVIQNTGPRALAGRGGAGGFAPEGQGQWKGQRRAIGYSIGVFFDTFENQEMRDPSNNYVGVFTFGRPEKAKWPPPRQGVSPRLLVEMKDGEEHEARISFRPPLVAVELDGRVVMETRVDLRGAADEEGKAWVGFTAATGGGYGNHEILEWNFESVDSNLTSVDSQITFATLDCLPERNLCTPREGHVEKKGEDSYVVTVPGNRDWSASIPNAEGRRVEILSASGYVCMGMGECVGAEGNLRMKTERGRTHFGLGERAREKNEGFFAVEIALR
jgi:hypothetical protein